MLIWKFTDSSVFNQWGKRLLLFSCKVMSDSATLCTVACQAPLSMGSSRQEYWSGLPFSSSGDLSDSGIKPESPASPVLQVDSYLWATREALGIRRIFFLFFNLQEKMLHFDITQLHKEGSAVCGWGWQYSYRLFEKYKGRGYSETHACSVESFIYNRCFSFSVSF